MAQKRIEYYNGQKINELTFLADNGHKLFPNGQKIRLGIFQCLCGKSFSCLINNVKSKQTQSCGCKKIRRIENLNKSHGLSYHPLYATWDGQKARCLNPKGTGYKYWGGRGIKFSDEFLDMRVWLDYVSSLPNYESRVEMALTLDRIDNNGNYERGNLRWVDMKTQNKNRRC